MGSARHSESPVHGIEQRNWDQPVRMLTLNDSRRAPWKLGRFAEGDLDLISEPD